MKQFRTYDLAVSFYRQTRDAKLPHYLKSQLLRAAASVALNLREGAAKRSTADRRRFYAMAYASLKECQAVLDLESDAGLSLAADKLGAHLYRLWQRTG